MFEKSRFGGTLSAAAKPNVNLTRRPVERPSSPATVPSGRSTPSATPPRVTPPSSPSFYRPVSPFSLPPSSPVMSAVRTSSSPLVVSDMSPAPPGLLPAPPGPLPAPPGPLPAPPGPLPAPPGPLPAPPLAAPDQFWLPVEMRKTIPQQDQRWIASELWRNQRLRPDVQLWYEPPVPALIYNKVPSPDRFFMHPAPPPSP
ncbi:vegetative cell wall protein gp1 [Gadus morhua]|uniref:vegetative cell wall protein gp1 n=1 Tax=Gadus morhua TaxID=8049 RepID=UPI0011B47CF0|nr:vegetative cell wall protein gp1-like [Gadus morhua]